MRAGGLDPETSTLEEIFLFALKGEVESGRFYAGLAGKVDNPFLRDKLEFLSREEEKHRKVVEQMYTSYFTVEDYSLPDSTPVPLPDIGADEAEAMSLAELLDRAAEAEKQAQEFYMAFANRLSGDKENSVILLYLASMEGGHYQLLKREKGYAEKSEERKVKGWQELLDSV